MVVLNDLYDYNLKIYQDNLKFKFSLDSLLLAEFIEIKASDKKILDLCSGNAPIPLILGSKNDVEITGIEIQTEICNLATKSIIYNKLEDKIEMLNINVKESTNYFPENNFDIITCNPPFFKKNSSILNESEEKAIARHEITITLEEIMQTTSILLKDNGKFYLVHRPERLQEILVLASKYHLIAKEIMFIFSKSDACAIMVLFKFVKNARLSTKISSKIINRNTKTYQNIFKNK